jgi:omega-amidase
MICNPFGKVVGELNEEEGILYQEIDFSEVEEVRNQIPVIKNRRNELYEVSEK